MLSTPPRLVGWQRVRQARWFWVSLLAFSLTRLGVGLIAYFAAPLLNDAAATLYHLRPPNNTIIDVLGSRWDTGFYVSIAEEGYKYEGVPLPSVAFWPLLPLAMRAVAWLVGDALIAGILITNLALLLATCLLYRLVETEWDAAVAERAVWYLLIFPTSFFGSAIYSESLFMLGAIGALYFMRKGYWESALLLSVMTTLTRFMGLLVAPLLWVEWLQQRRARASQSRAGLLALLAPLLAPVGTLAYMLYLRNVFGDPLAFLRASERWGRQPTSPLFLFQDLFRAPAEGWWSAFLASRLPLDNWIDLLFSLLFLICGFILLKQRRWSEGIFVVLGVLIPLSSGLLMSQRRYIWVLFPVFILWARWGQHPWVDRAIIFFSTLGLAFFIALFANGYWVG